MTNISLSRSSTRAERLRKNPRRAKIHLHILVNFFPVDLLVIISRACSQRIQMSLSTCFLMKENGRKNQLNSEHNLVGDLERRRLDFYILTVPFLRPCQMSTRLINLDFNISSCCVISFPQKYIFLLVVQIYICVSSELNIIHCMWIVRVNYLFDRHSNVFLELLLLASHISK